MNAECYHNHGGLDEMHGSPEGLQQIFEKATHAMNLIKGSVKKYGGDVALHEGETIEQISAMIGERFGEYPQLRQQFFALVFPSVSFN